MATQATPFLFDNHCKGSPRTQETSFNINMTHGGVAAPGMGVVRRPRMGVTQGYVVESGEMSGLGVD